VLSVYNWVKGMVKAIASVIVTPTGFWLIGRDMSGAQAGLILSFAIVASQGVSEYISGCPITDAAKVSLTC